MIPRQYTTILFDFDGTITPSLPLWVEASRHTLAQYKMEADDKTIVEKCFNRAVEDVMADFGISAPVDEFKSHISVGLHKAFQHATLFDGVTIVLEQCRQQGLKLGLVTSSPRKIVDMVLGNLEIAVYFGSTITADDITNYKPHPEPIHLALAQLEDKAESTLIIGDSKYDILAGHAAGIETGLFFPDEHTQFYNFNHLADARPHHVFKNYKEIAAHLDLNKVTSPL